jgi:very-short-patch-repair endonuclease
MQRVGFQQRQFAKRLRTAQTSLETAVWRELRAKRLDGWKFKRQAPIGPYVVDFICFERRLIVEVDGPLHEAAEQRLHDARRDAFLRGAGFRVLRFGEDAILRDLARVADEIRDALASPSPDP